MSEVVNLQMLSLDRQKVQPITLKIENTDDGKVEISTSYSNRIFPGHVLAFALRDLREDLEGEGWLLVCNASRLNVRAFGLAVNMGPGRRGFVLHLEKERNNHKKGSLGMERIPLLDPIDPKDVSTIEEQDSFFDQWLALYAPKR